MNMKHLLILISSFLCSVQAFSNQSWESLAHQGRYAEAFHQLSKNKELQSPFYLGVLAYKSQDWLDASNYLTEAISKNPEVKDYAYLFRGKTYFEKKQVQKAYDDFKSAEENTNLEHTQNVARFYQAEALRALKEWKKAAVIYSKIKRKLRRTEYYQDVLWGQLVAQTKLNNKRKICRLSKELYLKYPAYDQIKSWSVDLSKNTVLGKELGCFVTFNEQQLRIKRLLWAGREKKAHEEIQYLRARAKTEKTKYEVAEVLVHYLLHEGYVAQALETLAPYKKEKAKDHDFLTLLGKVYSKNQEQEKAIDSYYQASQVTKSHYRASQSLFQAAFLSYYSQDYKGAIKMFDEYRKKYPSGRDYANAYWYASWSKYLSKDYVSAGKDFISMLKLKKNKSRHIRRKWRDHPEEKLKYWLAMTWLRQGLVDKATPLFAELTHDDSMGYYSVAAFQRLNQLPVRNLASLGNEEKPVHENWWLPEAIASGKPMQYEEEELGPVKDPFEEEVDKILTAEDPSEDVFAPDVNITTNTGEQLAKDIRSIYFNTLEKSVQRARMLSKVAETRFAHQEILEVEGRKLTTEQRQLLLKAHEAAHSYNRLVILAHYFYANDRQQLGLHHGKSYWQYSYPKAYEKEVKYYTTKYQNVPPEFVWSIMRAETIYRPTAISPVGARGLMQVMPKTGRKLAGLIGEEFHVDELANPNTSIRYGSYYLSRLMKKFNQKVPLVAASYNGGPHRVHAWMHYFGNLDMDEFIEHIPFSETRNYVKKVTKYFAIYNLLYHKKTDAVAFLTEPLGFQLEGTIPTRETWERVDSVSQM